MPTVITPVHLLKNKQDGDFRWVSFERKLHPETGQFWADVNKPCLHQSRFGAIHRTRVDWPDDTFRIGAPNRAGASAGHQLR
jgi:hypothetical protein